VWSNVRAGAIMLNPKFLLVYQAVKHDKTYMSVASLRVPSNHQATRAVLSVATSVASIFAAAEIERDKGKTAEALPWSDHNLGQVLR
jgi:hypothetical protein